MTAITLNLLCDEQLAEQARARDPFKCAIALGGITLAGMAMTASLVGLYAGHKQTEAGLLETRLATLASGKQAAAATEFETLRATTRDLVALNRRRALCAPQLALLKDVMPDSIQLNRLALSVATVAQEQAPPAEEGTNNARARHRPAAKTVDVLALQMEGKAVSSRPEIEVDNFIQTLREHPVWSRQLKQVQLRSIARAPGAAAAADGLPVAFFVIECQYQETK
jgi:hypothetical protein